MKTRRKIALAGLLAIALCSLSGCTYDKLPPKTDDANSTYVTPKGVLPTDEEKALVEAAKAEYEQSITNQK